MTKQTRRAGQYQHLYNTARWHRLAKHQLRIEPLCRMCLSKGVITPGHVADHVEPHGGDVNRFFCGPLQTLCVRCHETSKKREEAAARGDL